MLQVPRTCMPHCSASSAPRAPTHLYSIRIPTASAGTSHPLSNLQVCKHFIAPTLPLSLARAPPPLARHPSAASLAHQLRPPPVRAPGSVQGFGLRAPSGGNDLRAPPAPPLPQSVTAATRERSALQRAAEPMRSARYTSATSACSAFCVSICTFVPLKQVN